MTRRVQARWSFRASFVKVIETENSLHLINEDRQNIYVYDFFSLFLGVQSAPKVGPHKLRNTLYIYRSRFRFLIFGDIGFYLVSLESIDRFSSFSSIFVSSRMLWSYVLRGWAKKVSTSFFLTNLIEADFINFKLNSS